MRWDGGRGGGGVEDRRGLGRVGIAGGGLGTLALALVGYFVFGIDPFVTQQVVSQFDQPSQQRGVEGTPEDREGRFVDVVSANVNDVWSAKLQGYQAPRVVLYEQGTSTACGHGQAAMGPFYCPMDRTVYLDLSFWREMETRLGASSAEFARAYVIAHEIGHHVQTITGTSERVRAAQQRSGNKAAANQLSVGMELQADCYAGVWAANASTASNGKVSLEPGDLEEGLRTARAIGDDALQKRSSGRVVPENFTHGSSEQRMTCLKRGYQSGEPKDCDTFAAAR
jgi:predicted metalloprotease